MGKRKQTPLIELIERRIDKTGKCWAWHGYHNPKGYACYAHTVNYKCKAYRVHRFMYEEYRGPIPDGFVVDHLCGNKGCVNPMHLELVSRAENNQRGNWRLLVPGSYCKNGHFLKEELIMPTKKGPRCRICDAFHRAKHFKLKAERLLLVSRQAQSSD